MENPKSCHFGLRKDDKDNKEQSVSEIKND
jgi:hypothetical protein